jgi:hypothetical protein
MRLPVPPQNGRLGIELPTNSGHAKIHFRQWLNQADLPKLLEETSGCVDGAHQP